MTRHTASGATDDESLDGLVIVDDVVQTTPLPLPGIASHNTVSQSTSTAFITNVASIITQAFILHSSVVSN